MPTDARRIQAAFAAAADITDPAERAKFLDGACAGDTGLRSRVEALLRAHDNPDSLLDHPAVAPHDPDLATTRTIGHDGDISADDEAPLGFLEPATRPDSLGRIGHYEVLQVLGQGGFGIVFRAFDEVLHRVVAVKVLSPQMAATSPARKRFLREARSSAQVRHEYVVQVYEVGEAPLPYIVMEFIPGETLQQRLDRIGPIDVADVVRIGRQTAEGLAAAHAMGLIHRDIKPGNILLEGGAGRVKITDFGLARAADDASISQSGIIAGTPMYMAPEQAKGDKIDQRADLFSLGSVLYVMAAGRPPFRANGTVAVLKRVADDTPRAIREIVPEIPQWLCDIIAKLHAKDPADRFQSAREVADVLADCEAQLKANAKLKDFSRIPQSKPAARKSGRRTWAVAAALLLPVLVLAGLEVGGVTHLFRGRQPAYDPIKPGGKSLPAPVAKPEMLPPTFKNGIGMEFVIVPKGKSWLGGGKDKLGDKEVEIPADFYLGKYEVTQEKWGKVMGMNPSYFSRNGGGKDAVKDISDADLKRFPVEMVSWDWCQVFVARLNQREREPGWAYRLPTEAEWEYACRGGPMADKAVSAFDFYLARPTNILLPDQANLSTALDRTCKVGSYAPNPRGLYDMHGNVWEWCDDAKTDANGGSLRAYRGAAYGNNRWVSRASNDSVAVNSYRMYNIGLRLARVPTGAPSPAAKTPPTVVPFTAADVKRIAALPAAEQVEEVRKELVRRNPGFDGTVGHKIEGGVVTEIRIVTDQVTDIAPIRAFNSLRVLDCSGTNTPDWRGNGQLADLSPLAGMNLAGLTRLNLNWTQVTDAGLLHFKDCQNLAVLGLDTTQVTDAGLANFKDCTGLANLFLSRTRVTDAGLASFKDCKQLTALYLDNAPVSDAGVAHFRECENLTVLGLAFTRVTDAGLARLKDCKKLQRLNLAGTSIGDAGLAYFKDCKNLTRLHVDHTKVTDLSLLKGMPLKELWCDFQPDRDAEILRSIKTLETINRKPAAEFWKDVEKE